MKKAIIALLIVALQSFFLAPVQARDLKEIQTEGVLRHLGIPYANFITDSEQGLDIEIIRLFAKEIGVRYEYVPATWKTVLGDLVGKQVTVEGNKVTQGAAVPVRGDVIANGLTILPWRQQVIDFSEPTFPTQVWLVAKSNSALTPIQPSGDLNRDIAMVKKLLPGKSVLGIAGTCLDPKLYGLEPPKADSRLFNGNLNELAPAILKGDAETTLLDVPDSLVALAKWPGEIKILGPLSEHQQMAVGFRKDSPELQQAFARFYTQIKKDGTYAALVKKYYPDVFFYYPEFFAFSKNKTP